MGSNPTLSVPIMTSRRQLWLGLALLVVPAAVSAQEPSPSDTTRVLLFERRFDPGIATDTTVLLRRGVVYWAEVQGSGTPEIVAVSGQQRAAFLVPIGDTTADVRRYQLFPRQDGMHIARLTDRLAGSSGMLRLYMDVVETERITEKRDRGAILGLSVAGGFHSGFRIDPIGAPRAGGDYEACLLYETERVGACVGGARQSFPNAGYSAGWMVLDVRFQLLSFQWLGRNDLGVSVRYSKGLKVGPRHHDPDMLGAGIFVMHRLSPAGRRHGWRVFAGWQHHRLSGAPETEFLTTERVTAGLIWTP